MAVDNAVENIRNRIWLTAKTRMCAEKRFRRYDILSHLVLSLLSVVVIAIALLRDQLPPNAPLEAYTAVFSVFILAASIIVFGFRFGETAILHRECYLRLQKLYDSNEPLQTLVDRYHDILSSYPNHSDLDYDALVLSRTFPNGEKLTSPSGSKVSWTVVMLIRFCTHFLILWALPVLLLTMSVGSIFWIW